MSNPTPMVPENGRASRPAARLLVAVFLGGIALPAIVQPIFELSGWFDRENSRTGEGVRDRQIQELDLLLDLNRLDVFRDREARSGRSLLRHIQDFESALEDRAVVSTALQPPTQWLQLTLFRQGNEKVVLGRDGWLFYRPGVEFITGEGFGGPAALRPNEKEASVNLDPLPAIVKFHEDLKARGIDLAVVPVPVKATIYPERLRRSYDPAQGPPVNRHLETFFRRLEEQGVNVIDLTPALWEAREKEELFLPLDSHWTPRGVSVFAKALGDELKKRFPYLKTVARSYEARPVEVSNTGDVFEMLKLPAGSRPFGKTRVTAGQVYDLETKKPVEKDERSGVVLLGDSAANIYSIGSMGWGESGGLPEHLCLHLGRPLHWITVNGGAPTATRRRLVRDGLAGRVLVVWEFIMRDLTHPDPGSGWEVFPLPEDPDPALLADLPSRLEVRAKIIKRSEPPLPDAAEIYPDTLTHTLYQIQEVFDGEYRESELLVVDWIQRDKETTEADNFFEGDVHHLVLEPLKAAARKDKSIGISNSVDDIKSNDLPAFWVIRRK